MFNLSKIAVKPQEKDLRDNTIGPGVTKEKSITDKKLPHRDGPKITTTTEDQFKRTSTADSQIIEKVLNEAKGQYMDHRSDVTWLSAPPISVLVEKMRQARLTNWNTNKQEHWSQGSEHKKQQGDLPKWPKNTSQHDKTVLENDPRRFENVTINDTQITGGQLKPLIGDITTADIDRAIHGIKTGASIDYDTAIIAILKQADKEQRELTNVERKAVCDLKIARTKALLSL
jgi:hypothetical protein